MRDEFDRAAGAKRVVALDAECDTTKNRGGFVIASGRTAVIQLGFLRPSTGTKRALVLQLPSAARLPPRLTALFEDPSFTFVGRWVGGDVKKIGSDFALPEPTTRAIKE